MQRLNRPPTLKVTVSKPKPRTQASGDDLQSGQAERQEQPDHIHRDSGRYGLLEHRTPSSHPMGYTNWETREHTPNPAEPSLDIDGANLAQLEALQQRITMAKMRITSNPSALPSYRSGFNSEPQPTGRAQSMPPEQLYTGSTTTVPQPLATRAPSSRQEYPVMVAPIDSSAAPLKKAARKAKSDPLPDDQAAELLQQAKKLSIFVHAWIETKEIYGYPRDKVTESVRMDRNLLAGTVSSLSHDKKARKKIFILRDLYDTLSPDFHELLALSYGPVKKIITKGAQTRSNFINTLKNHLSEIFHGYLPAVSPDPLARRVSQDCQRLLGYDSENRTFQTLPLLLFLPGSSGWPKDNALFRSRAVAIILLIVLFGQSSLQGKRRTGKATNGKLWRVDKINAAAVAWGCIVARFLLSWDHNFKTNGEETGIDYQKAYEQYKTLIEGLLKKNDTDMITTMQYYDNALLTSDGRVALAQDIHPEMITQASDDEDPVMLSLLREVEDMTCEDSDDLESAMSCASEVAASPVSWEVEEMNYDEGDDPHGQQELPPPLPSLAVSGKKKKKTAATTSKAKGKGRAVTVEKEPSVLPEKRPRPRPIQKSATSYASEVAASPVSREVEAMNYDDDSDSNHDDDGGDHDDSDGGDDDDNDNNNNDNDTHSEQELSSPLPSLAVSGKKKKAAAAATSKAKGKGRAVTVEKESNDLPEKRPRPRPVQVSSSGKSTSSVQPARRKVVAERPSKDLASAEVLAQQPVSVPMTRSTRSRPLPEDQEAPVLTSQPRRSTRGKTGTEKTDSSSAQPASTTRSRKTPPVSSKQRQRGDKITQSPTLDDSKEERVAQVRWKDPLAEWEDSEDFTGPERLRRKKSTTSATLQRTTSSNLPTIPEKNEGPSFLGNSSKQFSQTSRMASAAVNVTPQTVPPQYAPTPLPTYQPLPSRQAPVSSSTYQFTPDDDGEIIENPSDEDAIAHIMYYKNTVAEHDIPDEEESEEEDPDDESENESDSDEYTSLERRILQRR